MRESWAASIAKRTCAARSTTSSMTATPSTAAEQSPAGEEDLNSASPRELDPAAASSAVHVTFDERIEPSATTHPPEINRGEELVIRLYYRVLASVSINYRVSCTSMDRGPASMVITRRWGASSRQPIGRLAPTSRDEYRMPIGRMSQAPGYYKSSQGSGWVVMGRMTVTSGPHEADQRVRIGTITGNDRWSFVLSLMSTCEALAPINRAARGEFLPALRTAAQLRERASWGLLDLKLTGLCQSGELGGRLAWWERFGRRGIAYIEGAPALAADPLAQQRGAVRALVEAVLGRRSRIGV